VNILLLLYEYEPRVAGGMGGFQHALELGEEWTRLGHHVTVVQPRRGAAPHAGRVHVVESSFTERPVLRAVSAYTGLFRAGIEVGRRVRPDVVYAREMAAPVPLALARRFGVPLVLEVNGDSYRHRRDVLREAPWRIAVFRRLQRLNFTRADRIVTVTPGLRDALIARFGLPPERVVVVENGTGLTRHPPADPAIAKRAVGLDERRPTVGFVGMFFPHQGVTTLIDAAPAVLATRPDARFLLVGDGPARVAWTERATAAGVGAAFHFSGQVPYAEIALFIGAMDVCVAPFTGDRGEASPLKLFDYFACARPAVVSDIPAVRALVTSSGGGVLVPPDDPRALAAAITRLLGDDGERRRLGEAGRAWVVKDHSWAAVARRVLEVCHDAIAARGVRSRCAS
jgi:glycosyltransferase involved in cell wall biosynthesis